MTSWYKSLPSLSDLLKIVLMLVVITLTTASIIHSTRDAGWVTAPRWSGMNRHAALIIGLINLPMFLFALGLAGAKLVNPGWRMRLKLFSPEGDVYFQVLTTIIVVGIWYWFQPNGKDSMTNDFVSSWLAASGGFIASSAVELLRKRCNACGCQLSTDYHLSEDGRRSMCRKCCDSLGCINQLPPVIEGSNFGCRPQQEKIVAVRNGAPFLGLGWRLSNIKKEDWPVNFQSVQSTRSDGAGMVRRIAGLDGRTGFIVKNSRSLVDEFINNVMEPECDISECQTLICATFYERMVQMSMSWESFAWVQVNNGLELTIGFFAAVIGGGLISVSTRSQDGDSQFGLPAAAVAIIIHAGGYVASHIRALVVCNPLCLIMHTIVLICYASRLSFDWQDDEEYADVIFLAAFGAVGLATIFYTTFLKQC
jgi:hypothetical protein